MTQALAVGVYVAGRFYAAGAVPPEEVAALITNPKAWGNHTSAAPVVEKPAAPSTPGPVDSTDDPEDGEPFDPSAEGVGVDDVNNHLALADEAEVARVLAAEAAGKKRKGILEGPYSDGS